MPVHTLEQVTQDELSLLGLRMGSFTAVDTPAEGAFERHPDLRDPARLMVAWYNDTREGLLTGGRVDLERFGWQQLEPLEQIGLFAAIGFKREMYAAVEDSRYGQRYPRYPKPGELVVGGYSQALDALSAYYELPDGDTNPEQLARFLAVEGLESGEASVRNVSEQLFNDHLAQTAAEAALDLGYVQQTETPGDLALTFNGRQAAALALHTQISK